jgi:hypothetical protein
MALPDIPLPVFWLTPIFFILIILFTNWRYQLLPNEFIGNGTVFASLVIGFIFLYAMQKYDNMDLNVPILVRNVGYLERIALKYDPSLVCYLIRYTEAFLNFDNSGFDLVEFECELLPLIEEECEKIRVIESLSLLAGIFHQRVSKSNLIVNELWYLVFICCILLTIIFPMDSSFVKDLDSIIIIVLIWLPIVVVYYLYDKEINNLDGTLMKLIDRLKKALKKEGVSCKNIKSSCS